MSLSRLISLKVLLNIEKIERGTSRGSLRGVPFLSLFFFFLIPVVVSLKNENCEQIPHFWCCIVVCSESELFLFPSIPLASEWKTYFATKPLGSAWGMELF